MPELPVGLCLRRLATTRPSSVRMVWASYFSILVRRSSNAPEPGLVCEATVVECALPFF